MNFDDSEFEDKLWHDLVQWAILIVLYSLAGFFFWSVK